jgi:hypothetical protein
MHYIKPHRFPLSNASKVHTIIVQILKVDISLAGRFRILNKVDVFLQRLKSGVDNRVGPFFATYDINACSADAHLV